MRGIYVMNQSNLIDFKKAKENRPAHKEPSLSQSPADEGYTLLLQCMAQNKKKMLQSEENRLRSNKAIKRVYRLNQAKKKEV